MANRLILHEELCTILGSRNVYFQPPEGIRMQYPAIRYERGDIRNICAENQVYGQNDVYTLTVIDRNPDSTIVRAISHLPRARFDRHYVSAGLNHDVFTIYLGGNT